MGILLVAFDYLVWNRPAVAVDVAILIANGKMVDHEPNLSREVEEAERYTVCSGRS